LQLSRLPAAYRQFRPSLEQEFLLAVAVEVVRRQHLGVGQLRQAPARERVEDHEVGRAVAVLILDGGQDKVVTVPVQVVNQARAGRGDRDMLLVLVFLATHHDFPKLAGERLAVLGDRFQTGQGRVNHDQGGASVGGLEFDDRDRGHVRADGRAVGGVERLPAVRRVERPDLLMADDDDLVAAVAVQVGDEDQRGVEHAGHMFTDAKVRTIEAALKADQADVASMPGWWGLAAGGGGDLHAAHARQGLPDSGVAAEVVLVKPEVGGLARPATDHVGVHLARPGGGQQDAAGAVAGKIQDV
jgi:hypothetical protein